MAKTSLSGFPEWLPQQRAIERALIAALARAYELHGFAEIATRAIEPVSQLLAKGETSKEIYAVSRLQADAGKDAELGLHFDLTVPFARYVSERAHELVFPFKRYQIQPAWRGERPQDGRFREFIQADADVVGHTTLPLHYDAEMAIVIAEGYARMAELGVPPVRIGVNNRKLSEGVYRALGATDIAGVLAAVDKLAKIGPDAVTEMLLAHGLSAHGAQCVLELARLESVDIGADLDAFLARHGIASALAASGVNELETVVAGARAEVGPVVTADLSIARGLDYYTGSVFETTLVGHETLGSVGGGGRYDNLARAGSISYPGVGVSIGVSRIMSRILGANLTVASRGTPAVVLVAVNSEETRVTARAVARTLRTRGIACDVAPKADKFGKQIRHADRLGIPFVWFIGEGHEVKDIRTGEQFEADPDTWTPPSRDANIFVGPVG